MKVVCNSCEQSIMIDDAKVPAGPFRIKCSSCQNLIIVNKQEPAAPTAQVPMQTTAQTPSTDVDAVVKREVGKAKKEIFEAIATLFGADPTKLQGNAEEEQQDDRKLALICEGDQAVIDQISATLKNMGYQVDHAKTAADSLKKMDQKNFQLITVSSVFSDAKDGGAKILARVNGQKPSQRRQTFVVSISSTVKNADSTTAFLHGANIIVPKDDLARLETLIREGQRRFQQIYQHFNRLIEEKDQSY